MIAAWMLYTVAITLLLCVGGPTRFVWAAAITATLALAGRAVFFRLLLLARA